MTKCLAWIKTFHLPDDERMLCMLRHDRGFVLLRYLWTKLPFFTHCQYGHYNDFLITSKKFVRFELPLYFVVAYIVEILHKMIIYFLSKLLYKS